MTNREKNKFICENFDPPICWHELHNYADEDGIACSKCGKTFSTLECYTCNPDFTSKAGRIELLELMKAHKNYEDFADKLFVVCYWLKEKAVYAVPEPYMTDNTGKLRDEVFRGMGGVE